MNLDVTIGNDVWIGDGALIFPRVIIGDGAVIGARAVVNRDIPPYAVAVGLPAKVNSYRFEKYVIDILLQARWWDWPEEKIDRYLPLFLQDGFAEGLRAAADEP